MKEILLTLIISIMAVSLFSQISLAEETDFMNEVSSDIRDAYLTDYVERLYQEYAAENFSFVYSLIHPKIKEIMSEKEYIEFQKSNFAKYKTKYSQIDVNSEVKEIELPAQFKEIMQGKEKNEVLEIELSYLLEFESNGKQSREEENEVYIIVDEGKYYMLWDPSVMERDKK